LYTIDVDAQQILYHSQLVLMAKSQNSM